MASPPIFSVFSVNENSMQLIKHSKNINESKKRRVHVKNACVPCREAHTACDEKRPCTRCVKRNHPKLCVVNDSNSDLDCEYQEPSPKRIKTNQTTSQTGQSSQSNSFSQYTQSSSPVPQPQTLRSFDTSAPSVPTTSVSQWHKGLNLVTDFKDNYETIVKANPINLNKPELEIPNISPPVSATDPSSLMLLLQKIDDLVGEVKDIKGQLVSVLNNQHYLGKTNTYHPNTPCFPSTGRIFRNYYLNLCCHPLNLVNPPNYFYDVL
eukprot:TRINITY_DN2066_c0_g1_i2.p2 TRINITY_DN2066_c0_g1~~TRINITY_DN2066_c0_g1_i2.p2  ORF type:complete len:265 (+),score=12.50 TRINITY_DN2066_c0_g1_i2:111-905(+)